MNSTVKEEKVQKLAHKPLNMTLIIHALSAGGAERVMANVANYWAELGSQITLVTFLDSDDKPFYPLDPRIQLKNIKSKGKYWGSSLGFVRILQRILNIRRAVRESSGEVVICFMAKTNIIVLLATLFLKTKMVIAEHNDPKRSLRKKTLVWARRFTYSFADKLIVLSKGMIDYFPRSIREKSIVIPNPVIVPPVDSKEILSKPESKTLMAMGRLTEQKGFDFLLDMFSKISKERPDWRLKIWGEGPLRNKLEKQIEFLGLQGKAELAGVTKEPFHEMRNSDLFLLPSRFEGFPVVVLESLANGLPVVAFDCVCSMREIIENGVNGVVVPYLDKDEFINETLKLMADIERRKSLAIQGLAIRSKYSQERVMKIWEQMFRDLNL